jgi:hypothetical protein
MGFAPVGMSFPVKEVKDLLVKNYAEKRFSSYFRYLSVIRSLDLGL